MIFFGNSRTSINYYTMMIKYLLFNLFLIVTYPILLIFLSFTGNHFLVAFVLLSNSYNVTAKSPYTIHF